MVDAYHLLLLALLAIPGDTFLDSLAPPESLPALRRMAIEWDIADENTAWTALNMPFEIRWVRNALRECKDAPPSHHVASLLPTHEICHAQLEQCWTFLAALEKWQNQSEYAEQMSRPLEAEARWRLKVWELAARATDVYPFPWQRRVCLRALLEELGEADYYRGKLPGPVPVEMLRRRE